MITNHNLCEQEIKELRAERDEFERKWYACVAGHSDYELRLTAQLEAAQLENADLAMLADQYRMERDAAQADAARYRWIRDHDTMSETEGIIYRAHGNKAQIDAAIDEARAVLEGKT